MANKAEDPRMEKGFDFIIEAEDQYLKVSAKFGSDQIGWIEWTVGLNGSGDSVWSKPKIWLLNLDKMRETMNGSDESWTPESLKLAGDGVGYISGVALDGANWFCDILRQRKSAWRNAIKIARERWPERLTQPGKGDK